ncbi:MAG: OmpA family protein [Prevotellaceae bacterium]|jgi:outer membrane protein OmpA-like peptidoglycan-associated protein|nr:OmpA family protein [Prevotellaceae bacterium]
MKRSKRLKIIIGIIVVLLYSVQPGFAGFKLFSFLASKKSDPHCENCKFHISNLYLPYTLNSLTFTPVSKPKMIYDVDVDGDGIANRIDDCPATFGMASLKGCPPVDNTKSITYGNPTVRVRDEDFNLFVKTFSELEFEGAQQSLSKKSQKQLSDIVKFMKKEKRLFLYISAYVNISNNRMQNYYLSESRAQSVSSYLIKNGVESYRIGTMYFGDMMPVVDLPDTRFEVEICDKKK